MEKYVLRQIVWLLFAILSATLAFAKLITGNFVIHYTSYIKQEFGKYSIGGFHLFFSVLPAFTLPNNYLDQLPFFQNLYVQNGMWVPVSMLAIIFIDFIIIGIVLSLIVVAIAVVFGIKQQDLQQAEEIDLTLFPGGEAQVDEELETVLEAIEQVYPKDLLRSAFIHAARLFFYSDDKSEGRVTDGILHKTNGQITRNDAKVMHDYFYQRMLFDVCGRDENLYALMNDNEDLTGYDKDEIPEGTGEFGWTATNPIPVKGIASNDVYLNRLRTPLGRNVQWERGGSVLVSNILNPVDKYHIFSDNQEIAVLYLSPYHKRISNKAPEGFSLAFEYSDQSEQQFQES